MSNSQESDPSGSNSSPPPPPPKRSSSPGSLNTRQSPPFPLPKLTIFQPLPAWNSHKVDERCFVYCSQTSHGRSRRGDPFCRSICFRRVFGHEVHDGTYDSSKDINNRLRPKVPQPLPHEGQPREAILHSEIQENDKTKYWKEGRYIWVSKSRWATQEKVDSMMSPISVQTDWLRYKEAMERRLFEEEMDRLREQSRLNNAAAGATPNADDHFEGDDQPPPDNDQGYNDSEPQFSGTRYSCPPIAHSAIRDSLLFRITPLTSVLHEALYERISFLLAPTHKILDIFSRSFSEGTQTRFFAKAFEQATNGSTLALVRNVWNSHETRWKELEEEREMEERKKKSGGNEVG